MNDIIKMYEEELNILENLMVLAQEDGRGDRYRKYAKEYYDKMDERDYYISLYA